MNFEEAQQLFNGDNFIALANDPNGRRFLQIRSLNRTPFLDRLFQAANITPVSSGSRDHFREAFDSPAITPELTQKVIRDIYEESRVARRESEDNLVNNLYRLQVFDWGGLYQNSLEKIIVNNYVKKITDYDQLIDKLNQELQISLRGYVFNSWYNHWTSIIIEDIFRDHPSVLPAVGKVKKIDFFVREVPFDLKVTYLPEGYIQHCRRADKQRPELTLIKRSARRYKIPINTTLPPARLLEDLWIKHRDHPDANARRVVSDLRSYRLQILDRCAANPTPLIIWLYENQGERRFDSANRLFLLLVDRENMFDSWKLKRAKPLLHDRVTAYLNGLENAPGRDIAFNWGGKSYHTVADMIIVEHP